MKLSPLDSQQLLELAAGWLSQPENAQWLDTGDGRPVLGAAWLKILTQRDTHLLRVFGGEGDSPPVGLIALSEISRRFRTARIWVVVGDRSFRARGYGTYATEAMLTMAFGELGLRSVNTWIVDGNPSQRIAERLGFTFIGRQRQCHFIDGQLRDRLWFDILAAEHMEHR
ncbi:MAG TPA: GNAT family protein [Gemmatimonadales bacterium]|nr:GNAT family protein [Gemmatimonadales bacterium]